MPDCNLNVTSEDVADFIYQYTDESPAALAEAFQTSCIDIVNRDYAIAYRPLEEVVPISIARYGYTTIPKLYGLLDKSALAAAGISPVVQNPEFGATGQGVMIGFIDTGIDYQHPLFRNPDGSSRIYGIWDQSIPSPPEEHSFFLYGTTYSHEQINAALASDHPLEIVPSRDTNGHGTFMAGVAAGNNSEEDNFMGAAPDSMIAVVKLKPAKQYLRDFYLIPSDAVAFQENDIMLGIRYLLQLSVYYRTPIVIYIGVGTNQGGHTGDTPLGSIAKTFSISYNALFVTGAGNENGLHHHFSSSLPSNREYEDVEIQVADRSC